MRAVLPSLFLLAACLAGCGQPDHGAGGSCDVVVCDAPPPAACVDATTLGAFEPGGTCDQGICAYREELITCEQGCSDGGCVGEPCAGVHCSAPPPATCVDDTTLRSYDPAGTCSDGACSYVSRDTTCAQGCADGACVGDPCAGVTCSAPPSPTCVDADDLRTYASSGTCSDGACSYDSSTITCQFGCAGGACVGDPCAGVTCDQPPAAYCKDAVTLKSFADTGTCAGGGCTYAVSETVCPHGCAQRACQPDPCVGVTCDAPPAPTCVGDALRVWSAAGTCGGGGSCSYPYVDEACPNGCSGDACIGDTCGSTTCDHPPADTCKDVSTATIHAPLGTCDGDQCAYQANDVTCSNGCLNGACLPGSWTAERSPLTKGQLVSDTQGRLVLDAAGRPHELVCDEFGELDYNEDGLYGWKQTAIESGLTGGCNKGLALGPDGTVYVAYGDPVNGILRFAERAPGAATFTKSLVTSDKYSNSGISIVVDATGHPVVAFVDTARADVRIATRTSGTWSFEHVMDTGLASGDLTDLAFAPNGDLHLLVGYSRVSPGASTAPPVGHAVRSGGTWSAHQLVANGLIGAHSLGFTPAGDPYFLYASIKNYDFDLVVDLPGIGPIEALQPGYAQRVPVLAYDFFGADVKVVRSGDVNNLLADGAVKLNGAWWTWQPVLDWGACDGVTGADGRTRFLSPGWGVVTTSTCQPACGSHTCGSDGCGGTCGTCGPGKTCSTSGFCQ